MLDIWTLVVSVVDQMRNEIKGFRVEISIFDDDGFQHTNIVALLE